MSGLNGGTIRGTLNTATVMGVVGGGNVSGVIGNGIAYVDGTTEPYTGEYTITPRVTAQSIPCANKKMMHDVDIKAVPYYETSNDDGTTVYIAAEVDE